MAAFLERYDYKRLWNDIHTDHYEGVVPRMADYHIHEFYEISIIISGNVNVLLNDTVESGSQPKVVLLRPFTPHYIYCEPNEIYNRRNIVFSPDFISQYVPEWQNLLKVFPRNGCVLKVTPEQCETYFTIANEIEKETSTFRKRILLLYLLSLISDETQEKHDTLKVPKYITDALSYINKNYSKRIVAVELADRFGIGRTTFMTSFKKYTGTTLTEYINHCRLKNAILALQSGEIEQKVAEECGFGDACNMIRCFKRSLGMTPKKYIKYFY